MLNISQFHNVYFSFYKVVWLQRYGVAKKNDNDFIANFLLNPKMNKILKSANMLWTKNVVGFLDKQCR